MKFEKSKVQTVVTADNVKVGSKGYFANKLSDLQKVVENSKPLEVKKIDEDGFTSTKGVLYQYFYPVEEAEENESDHSCINYQMAAKSGDLIKRLEKKYGDKKAVLKHCADTTKKFLKRIDEITDEISKFQKDNEEVVILGDLSVVMGVRYGKHQGCMMLTGSPIEMAKNIAALTAEIMEQ